MADVALGLSIAAIVLSLISIGGLIWAIGEFRGFQRSKYVTMFPNMQGDLEGLIPENLPPKEVKKKEELLSNMFGVPDDYSLDDI